MGVKLAKMTPGHIINATINDLLHHAEFKHRDENKKNKLSFVNQFTSRFVPLSHRPCLVVNWNDKDMNY